MRKLSILARLGIATGLVVPPVMGNVAHQHSDSAALSLYDLKEEPSTQWKLPYRLR